MFNVASSLRKIVADPDLALDLGTANTRLYARGRGVVADEPSVIEARAQAPEAIGVRRVSDPRSRPFVFPVRAGVVVDVDAAAALLSPLVRRARRLGLVRPRALVCTPTDASGGEREALVTATRLAGASVVAVAPEPLAAALGVGLDLWSPYARMLVDIGSGVTDIAVIRSGRMICSAAVRTACSDLERAVTQHVATCHGLMLNPGEAVRLMSEAGVYTEADPETLLTAKGIRRHRFEISIRVTDMEIRRAMNPVMDKIITKISTVLRDLPHSVACEVIEDGVCLTGGGACLPGVVERIAAGTMLDVIPATNPLHAVIQGAARMLSAIDQVPRLARAWF